MNHRIVNGDIMRFAAHYRGPKFHAVLCDPPYELGFMGKSWDSRGVSFLSETWSAISSLLLPGAHLLAFGGTRTFHRIAVAIEDAGLEIRDTIGWIYGSGFPKSHDVSKAIDREAGAEREVVGKYGQGFRASGTGLEGWQREAHAIDKGITIPATDEARAWQGYGTALKPAWEPVIVARKPLESTVARNCVEHGCGALNVDGTRVPVSPDDPVNNAVWHCKPQVIYGKYADHVDGEKRSAAPPPLGRWPANIIHDGSDETAHVLGDAARFFYCAKASSREREEGLDGFDGRKPAFGNDSGDGLGRGISNTRQDIPRRNHHPTVKPIALTTYLAKLIMPPSHVESRILVPFSGSGSECIGAALAGWKCVVGVEREAEYAAIARARLEHWTRQEVMA